MSIKISSFLPADGDKAARAALAPQIANLQGSQILKIAAEVKVLQDQGREICNLTVGDFAPGQFGIPKALAEGIVSAVRAGHTNYPPADGVPELKRAIARLYSEQLGLDYSPDSVCVGSGARPPIFAAWQMFVSPGDRTMSFLPAWNVGYYAHLFGSQHTFVETTAETNFFPTVEQVEREIRDCRLIVLNSPLNPTGTMIADDVLAGIAQLVVDENRRRVDNPVILLYDQVYWMLTGEGLVHKSPVNLVPEVAPWVIHVDAVSKSFAGTGLRIGWGVMPEYFQRKMKALIGHMGAWAPRAGQLATASFLDDTAAVSAYMGDMNRAIRSRLDAFYDGFVAMAEQGLPVHAIRPQGAIYMSLRLDLIGSSRPDGGLFENNEQIRSWLLNEAGVAVVPFDAFDLPADSGWFRLSVGAVSVDEVGSALGRLESALRAL